MPNQHHKRWSLSHIAAAKKILSHCHQVEEALEGISKATGFEVTYDMLRSAFKRAKEPSVSTFLKSSEKPMQTPRDRLVAKIEAKDAARERHRKGLTQLMLEKLQASVEGIKPDTIKVIRESSTKNVYKKPPEVLWFDFSDVQLGTYVDKEKLGGLNEHDWQIWLQKLDNWFEAACNIIRERQQFAKIEKIVLAFVGDIVEGHEIFKGQAYELELDIWKQTLYGARDITQAVARLASTFPHHQFQLVGVGGNHGRLGRLGEAPYRCNFDLILYEFMRLRLSAMPELKNIACEFPEAWYQVVKTWGWTHLLVHLDDVKGSLGLPFYGLQRYLGKQSTLLQRTINYLHGGHFHTEADIPFTTGSVLVNGNWIGATGFTTKQIVEGNTPVQMCYVFTELNGLETSYKIYLKSRSEMKPRVKVLVAAGGR